jgi:hypothetical protein
MTYSANDAYNDIGLLEGFWQGSGDYAAAIDAMRRLIYDNAPYDPAIKLTIAGSNLFADALSLERNAIDSNAFANFVSMANPLGQDLGYQHPPRWYLLDGITKAITPGFFSFGQQGNVTDFAAIIDPAGQALASTIQSDPDPQVQLAALQLVKSTALPKSWAGPLTSALNALGVTLQKSALDPTTRGALVAAAADAKANVLTSVNPGQGTNFVSLVNGQEIELGPQPSRAVVLPWYKRIEIWGGLLGGVIGGVELANRYSKR